jgi:hypothetical protein
MACFKALSVPPLGKGYVEGLSSRFAITDALLDMLRLAETYHDGASKLKYWENSELLLSRGNGEDSLRSLSVGGYERIARTRNFGHTAAAVKELGYVIRELGELRDEDSTITRGQTLDHFERLRDSKISRRDLEYIGLLSGLLSKREEMRNGKVASYAAGAGIAVAVLAVVRFIFAGEVLAWEWNIFTVIILVMTILCSRPKRRHILFRLSVLFYSLIFIGLLIVEFVEQPRIASLCFPLAGAPLGAIIAGTVLNRRMNKNLTDIVRACNNYVINEDEN